MLVDVAIPVPLPHNFTYRSPAPIAAGTRVRVRFSGRQLTGWVVGPAEEREGKKLHDIEAVLETEPSVPADILELLRWVADYYVAPLGLVLRSALPVALSGAVRPDEPVKKRKLIRIVRELPTLSARAETFRRAQRQRELYELLESLGGSAELAHVTGQLGFAHAIVRALADRELVQAEEQVITRDPFAALPADTPAALTLTAAQQRAVAALRTAAHNERVTPEQNLPFLLHGVTGSGKTLVYIEVLREVLARGRGAIVLVPEIALTPQTVARFRSHFGDTIAVLHSALSDGERYDAWRALHSGQRRVAIGARSAVFAPVRNLGAIVVDEEHEASYKQGDTSPRYHAREVAIVRARLASALCVLGSATPALESWHNAQRGKFRLLELPERVEGRPLPPVRVIDLRRTRTSQPNSPSRPNTSSPSSSPSSLSPELATAIQARLDRREQAILLLNRRGYSTFVQCRECGAVWQCLQCNVSLTYHRGRQRLVCHYCFHEEPPPAYCARCGSGDLSFRGVGTEQVEREVIERFPNARVSRMDVDTTSAKWAHHDILSKVEKREIDILLGTQMIAKGLDFPGVTLVGVINADVAMNLPDFRAGERTFQLLTQVAGRAGRGPLGGEVMIQTALPTHYAIVSALEHDYHRFAERELEERRAPTYPPHVRLVNVVVSGTDDTAVQQQVQESATWLLSVIDRAARIELIGPAPCPIDRIRGRWRWHFLLRSPSAGTLAAVCRRLFLQHTIKPGRSELRLAIDRDPVSLL
jgi:primosomal protein N' (replication factor Y) (superfamily II helicase)